MKPNNASVQSINQATLNALSQLELHDNIVNGLQEWLTVGTNCFMYKFCSILP